MNCFRGRRGRRRRGTARLERGDCAHRGFGLDSGEGRPAGSGHWHRLLDHPGHGNSVAGGNASAANIDINGNGTIDAYEARVRSVPTHHGLVVPQKTAHRQPAPLRAR